MKKALLISVAILASTLSVSAKVTFKHLDNNSGTNLILVDNEAGENVKVDKAVLHNNGKDHEAKNIDCDLNNGVATYKLKFTKLTTFDRTSVTLRINDEDVTVTLPISNLTGNIEVE